MAELGARIDARAEEIKQVVREEVAGLKRAAEHDAGYYIRLDLQRPHMVVCSYLDFVSRRSGIEVRPTRSSRDASRPPSTPPCCSGRRAAAARAAPPP